MNKKIIILGVMLSLITAPAYARSYPTHFHSRAYKVHIINPLKGLRHQRLIKSHKGTILIYNP